MVWRIKTNIVTTLLAEEGFLWLEEQVLQLVFVIN